MTLNMTKLVCSGAVEAGQICISMCAGAKMESCSALNPVDVGACHGMTLEEIREKLGSACLEVKSPPTHTSAHVVDESHSVCIWQKFVCVNILSLQYGVCC
jgi:hypothetical protein